MPSCWSCNCLGCAFISLAAWPLMAASGPAAAEGQQEEKEYDGKTIAAWIRAWDGGRFEEAQQAQRALAGAGQAAVPALTRLIQDNHRHAGYALKTLAEMGAAARPALPLLLRLARDKSAENPDGWTWNVPLRSLLFTSFAQMSWAAQELIPLLEEVGHAEDETDQIRGNAVHALHGMGAGALKPLRRLMASPNQRVRHSAAQGLVEVQHQAGTDKNVTRQRIIDQNPFAANVPRYLAEMKGIFNLGRVHPPTQRIKQIYRRQLAEKPDAEVAWLLATIIRNGLAGTELSWAAPSDEVRSRHRREDADENFETLASAIQLAFAHAEPQSELWNKAGLSLAKLRLLQGNWTGMNAALIALGQEPVPAELRPILPPPPSDWHNLKQNWQPADESIRSGNCAIAFRFVKRGKPLQGIPGVHVLVKRRPPANQNRVFFTGVRVDTLLYATLPLLEPPYDSFGYRGADRPQCRYGVSNEHGFVLIEGLPKAAVTIEILVPTGNFEESAGAWDLLMNTGDGLQIADRNDPRSVSVNEPPALIELSEGETARYPLMFVSSQLTANVEDWDPVDEKEFVLSWDAPRRADIDHYHVKLTLSAPAQHPQMAARSPAILTAVQQVNQRTWPLGERGVGGLRLVPGNLYLLEIEALRGGDVVASLPRQRIWVPWDHRETDPPLTGNSAHSPPIYHNIFFRTNVNGKPLEQRLPPLLRDSARMFETEYNRLGLAWLDLHKNKPRATDELQRLVAELPPGNVVRSTALSLLTTKALGRPIPRRLEFVAAQSSVNSHQ